MNPKTEAIYRQFPFLERHFPKESVSTARVSRISKEFLDQRSQFVLTRLDDGTPIWCSNGEILLFDKKGELLAEVGAWQARKRFLFWSWLNRESFVESVGQALLQIGANTAVHYAAWFNRPGAERELIVYKPPKDFTIQEWYEERVRRDERSIRNGVRAIDNEASH